jgi:head-tail adaptor
MAGPLGKRGMHAGRLRNRVRVETPTPTRTEYGDERLAWATQTARVFCKVEASSGRDLFASGQIQTQVTHKVTMRRDTATLAITPKNRLVWLDGGSVVLNIVAVLDSVGEANFRDVWCLQET